MAIIYSVMKPGMMKFWLQVKFDLEGHGQSPLKTKGILTNVFYTCGPNLVILAWTGDEFWHGQAPGWHMDKYTDTQTNSANHNTRRPKLALGINVLKERCLYKKKKIFQWTLFSKGRGILISISNIRNIHKVTIYLRHNRKLKPLVILLRVYLRVLSKALGLA